MKSYAEIIITPQELRLCNLLYKKIVIEKEKYILIKGRVLDSKHRPVQGAVIVVKSIYYNYIPPKINEVGYVITNIYGEYAINLKKIYNVNYKLDMYEPLIKNKI